MITFEFTYSGLKNRIMIQNLERNEADFGDYIYNKMLYENAELET